MRIAAWRIAATGYENNSLVDPSSLIAGPTDATSLVRLIERGSLEVLSAASNTIGDTGALLVAEALSEAPVPAYGIPTALTSLNLAGNSITDKGGQALAR